MGMPKIKHTPRRLPLRLFWRPLPEYYGYKVVAYGDQIDLSQIRRQRFFSRTRRFTRRR
jgi:hypothetical protein